MPRAAAHLALGCLTGGVVSIGLQLHRITTEPNREFDCGELLLCIGAAGAAAMLPDLLEPATSPNHRGFFHSLAMAALVAYFISGKHTTKWSAKVLMFLGVAGLGYLSHLGADACTPKSLRIL